MADVLRHAARIIEERGWVGPDRAEAQHGHCAWGAINMALPWAADPNGHDAAVAVLIRHLGLEPRIRSAPEVAVWYWNDAPGRTAAEVTAALRAAADKWEADR